jgi:prevent-host-death family protein
MREMSVREANQNFSQLIAAAERGETIIITKNGKPVARVSPQTVEQDEARIQEGRRKLEAYFSQLKPTGVRVADLTDEDYHGPEWQPKP